MKFGIREVTDIVFRTVADGQQIGDLTIANKYTPVLFMDSAKMSSLESTVATVYAQGGRGNPRLLAWDGDRVVTFKFEDVILSKRQVAMLSGANTSVSGTPLLHLVEKNNVTTSATTFNISLNIPSGTTFNTSTQVYFVDTTAGEMFNPTKLSYTTANTILSGYYSYSAANGITIGAAITAPNGSYIVDYYVAGTGTNFQVEAGKFAGYYIVEANTLFRGLDGVDYPAQFTIPRGKLKTNFTFTMAPTGDPSTFTFEVDAFPGTTKLITTKPVLFQLNIIDNGFDQLV